MLTGKVAIVTGAAHGIGRATAELLASHGAHVVVADIQAELGRQVVQGIQESGGSATFSNTDVGHHDQIRRLVEKTVTDQGRLDIVANDAYWSRRGSVVDLSEEDWDRAMAVMLKATFLFGKYAVPAMIKQGGGAIVNITSVHSYAAYPGFAVYDTAKAGLLNLTRQMAVDFGPHNIRVNAISPGWIRHADAPPLDDRRQAEIRRLYPLQRTGRPEEIAGAVLFLVSDQASFVTGQALLVDGGMTAQLADASLFVPDYGKQGVG